MDESNRGPEDGERPAPGADDPPAAGDEAPPGPEPRVPGDPIADNPAAWVAPDLAPVPADPASAGEASIAAEASFPPAPAGPPIMRGLWIWFVIITGLGVAGLARGEADLALTVTLAGAFVAAHAADRDPAFVVLHRLLAVVFVGGGAGLFAALAMWLVTNGPDATMRPFAVGVAAGGAALCLLSAVRPISDGLAEALFHAGPSRALRLGGRLVMMVLLFAFPGWAAFPGVLDTLAGRNQPLVDTGQLLASAVGLSVLALGAVGFLVRRNGRETLERLGLRGLKPAHLVVAAIGVAALAFLNASTEALQHRWFPDLWEHDQRMSQLIAGGLGIGGSLVLGVSAGLGEELSMRGALQPRLGLLLTSLVFAALHVHYSWYGMLTIFLLGILLGVLRQRTSTTVAIVVHSLYDITAVFVAGGAAR